MRNLTKAKIISVGKNNTMDKSVHCRVCFLILQLLNRAGTFVPPRPWKKKIVIYIYYFLAKSVFDK